MDTAAADASPPDELEDALRANWRPFAAAAVFSGAINLLYLSSPLYLTQVYNRVLTSGSVSTLFSLTVVLALAIAVMALLEATRARVLTRTTGRFDRLLSGRVFAAIVDRVGRPGLSTQNSQPLRDLDQVRATLSGPTVQFLFDAPWLPIFLLILFLINWLLGVVGLLGAIVLIVLALANERVTKASVGLANEAASRSYLYADVIVRSAEVVRAMGLVEPVHARWASIRRAMLREQVAAADRGADVLAGTRFARLMLQSLMLGTGALLSLQHAIQPATIFAASIIMGRALSPVEQAIGAWRSLTATREAVERLRKLLHASPLPAERALRDGFDGSIEVEHLTYVVPGRRETVLHDLDFTIAPGDAVGIIGPSGAGKSTLARLLIGAVAPTEGEVRLGGALIDHWTPESLGDAVGYLPQDVQLLPGSLRDNIGRLGRFDEAQVLEAVRRAGVERLIGELPQGLDTELGDAGLGLSGGQRQRIGLARAIVGEPRLLVLDEPNANLDAEGEAALAAAMQAMRRLGATLVVVAHRPSALEAVDTLLLLREGRLESMGPKAELIDRLRGETRTTRPPKPGAVLKEAAGS